MNDILLLNMKKKKLIFHLFFVTMSIAMLVHTRKPEILATLSRCSFGKVSNNLDVEIITDRKTINYNILNFIFIDFGYYILKSCNIEIKKKCQRKYS